MNEVDPHDELFRAAAAEDGTKIIEDCARAGLNLNIVDPQSGITPLYQAVVLDRRRNVAELLNRGAYPEFRFTFSSRVDKGHIERDRTALFYAKSAETANLLLDAGANPNAIDAKGLTPLVNAILRGRADVVRVLIERHADASILIKIKKRGPMQSALDIARQQHEFWRSMSGDVEQSVLARRLAAFDEIIQLLGKTESDKGRWA